MAFSSCETIFTSSYRTSMAGLKISTLRFAILALFRRRINSSVLPLNIEPQITSIHPRRSPLMLGSINIVKICYDYNSWETVRNFKEDLVDRCDLHENCLTYTSPENLTKNSFIRSKVAKQMERIQALINRLQEQVKQNADPAQMQMTVQLLQSEINKLQ